MTQLSKFAESLNPTVESISKRLAEGGELSLAEQALLLSHLIYRDWEDLWDEINSLKESLRVMSDRVGASDRRMNSFTSDVGFLTGKYTTLISEVVSLRKDVTAMRG
jgi:hypothetical protein